jgi:hypothetical protein
MSRSRDFGAAASSLAAPASSNNGYSIAVDTTQANGLNYAGNQAAGKNVILNGAFDLNQRNAGSVTSGYIADRWSVLSYAGTATWQRVALAPGSFANQVANYAIRITSTSSANDLAILTAIEDVTTFAGQQATISFWARLSSGTSNLDLIQIGQNFGTGGTSTYYTYVDSTNQPYSTAWTKLKYTVTMPSVNGTTIGANNAITIRIDPTTTLANGVWFEIAEIQFEAGPTATRFTRAGGSITNETLLCQRHYYRASSEVSYGLISTGKGYNTNIINATIPFPVQMRAIPTIGSDYSALSTFQYEYGSASGTTPTSIALNPNITNTRYGTIDITKASAFTAGAYYYIMGANNANAYIGFSADL